MWQVLKAKSSLAFESVCKPAEGLLEPSTLHGWSLEHLPLAILYVVEAETRGNLVVVHRSGHVLFIGQNEDWNTTQFILL